MTILTGKIKIELYIAKKTCITYKIKQCNTLGQLNICYTIYRMNSEKKNSKSLLQQFIDLLARIFFIKRKPKKMKESETDDIYPLW